MNDLSKMAYDIISRNVASAFNNAAKDYDKVSLLQQTIADRLIESFELIKINPTKILDLTSPRT